MWTLLLLVAWAMCGMLGISHKVGYKVDYELAKVFMVLAWLLFVLHMVALGYFRSCVAQILAAAGYSNDRTVLIAKLEAIADREAKAWQKRSSRQRVECN